MVRFFLWVIERQSHKTVPALPQNFTALENSSLDRNAELARIEAAAHIAAAKHIEVKAARVEIEAIRSKIAGEAAKRNASKAAEAAERAATETLAYTVISASAANRALHQMQQACNSWPKSSARSKFEDAQSELEEMIKALEAAGLRSPEIKHAVCQSWNRIGKDGRFLASRPTFLLKGIQPRHPPTSPLKCC